MQSMHATSVNSLRESSLDASLQAIPAPVSHQQSRRMHQSLAVNKSHISVSLAKYLEDKNLPSVAEMNNSAKKEAIVKKEIFKNSGSQKDAIAA